MNKTQVWLHASQLSADRGLEGGGSCDNRLVVDSYAIANWPKNDHTTMQNYEQICKKRYDSSLCKADTRRVCIKAV